MLAGLLHALEILAHARVDDVRDELGVGALADAALPVEEPLGDAVLCAQG